MCLYVRSFVCLKKEVADCLFVCGAWLVCCLCLFLFACLCVCSFVCVFVRGFVCLPGDLLVSVIVCSCVCLFVC